MQNRQVKNDDKMQNAFRHLDLRHKGFHFYTTMLAKALISDVCMEASLPVDPPTEYYYSDKAVFCGQLLDFWAELAEMAKEYEQQSACPAK